MLTEVTHFSAAGTFLSSHICPELRLVWTLRFYSSFWRASLIDSGSIRLRFHPEIRTKIRNDTHNRVHFGAFSPIASLESSRLQSKNKYTEWRLVRVSPLSEVSKHCSLFKDDFTCAACVVWITWREKRTKNFYQLNPSSPTQPLTFPLIPDQRPLGSYLLTPFSY